MRSPRMRLAIKANGFGKIERELFVFCSFLSGFCGVFGKLLDGQTRKKRPLMMIPHA